jgi:tripartite ATP-independent transporter DctM subunit
MEVWVVLVVLFVGLFLLLASGLPVAFALGVLNTFCVLLFFSGGTGALTLVADAAYDSVSGFSYIAVPLFVLMGEVLMHSGLAGLAITAVDSLVGRVPGRLGVISTLSGAIFGAASGSSMASVATIGTILIPEMEKRGYARWLSTGAVCCAGALAILIPPSSLMVIFAGIAGLPVSRLLIAGVVPGLTMAFCLAIFIIFIALLRPKVAPREAVTFDLRRAVVSLRHLIPIGGLVLIVIGGIFAGVVTPSEAAALGAGGAFLLAAIYRRLTFDGMKKALIGSVRVSGMAFFIIAACKGFAHTLAYTGAGPMIVRSILGLSSNPLIVIALMAAIVFLMGFVMDAVAIMLIVIPIFMPIAEALGMDLTWWGLVMMVNIEIGLLTPPFGLNLFVAKGILGDAATMEEVYKAIMPFVLVEAFVVVIIIFFPSMVTWLPGLMR